MRQGSQCSADHQLIQPVWYCLSALIGSQYVDIILMFLSTIFLDSLSKIINIACCEHYVVGVITVLGIRPCGGGLSGLQLVTSRYRSSGKTLTMYPGHIVNTLIKLFFNEMWEDERMR